MNDRAEELLAGPRGRRLCIELAKTLNQHVGALVFWLSYELDPGKGISRVLTDPRDRAAAAEARDAVSVDQLATALTGMDLSGIFDEDIHAALSEAVDTAMGWQQSDGEDVLTSHPSIQTALRPVAERVLDSAPAQQWEPPRHEVQWVIDFDWEPIGDFPPLHRDDPQSALAAWAQEQRAEEARAVATRPANPDASWSGTWWSTPHGVIATVGQIPAGLDLIEDGFGWKKATVTQCGSRTPSANGMLPDRNGTAGPTPGPASEPVVAVASQLATAGNVSVAAVTLPVV